MNDMVKKRLLIFSGITVIFLVINSLLYYQGKNEIFLSILMMTPMVSVILTRIVTKEGTKDLYLKPRMRRNIKWYLMAYLLTPFIAYLGAALFFILNPSQFDLLNSNYAVKAGVDTLDEYFKLLATTIPLAILINPIIGLLSCFGEEIAWRGYLLPKLCKKLSIHNAILATGVIWGLWHAPIIAMGYNYGTSNTLLGIVAMVILCIILGIIESFLFIKTQSIWPSVVFHASINAIDLWTPSELFMSKEPNPFIGPDLIGIVGGFGFVVIAIICFISLYKNSSSVTFDYNTIHRNLHHKSS